MNVTLVDTDILIDVAMSIDEAVDCLADIEKQSRPAISAITEMELLVGCRNKGELQKTERLLERFQVFHLNERISSAAVELIRKYRLSHGLLIPDALIAATALTQNFDFITKNQRDSRMY